MQRFVPGWAIVGVLILSFATVWLRLSLVRRTYELNEATKILHNLRLEKERIDLRVAQLRSPRRLEQLAREKFHLSPPSPNRVISLKEE